MKIKAIAAALLAAAIAVPVSLPVAQAETAYSVKTDRIRTHEYTVTDATKVQMVEAELARLTIHQRSYYDIDFDGKITIADATIIQMHCANLLDVQSDEYLGRFAPAQPTSPAETEPATVQPGTQPTDAPLTMPFETETTAPEETTAEPATQDKIEETEPTSTEAASSAPVTEPTAEVTEPSAEVTEPATEPTEVTEPTYPSEDMTYPPQPTYLRLDYASLKIGVNESFTFTVETDAPGYTFRCFNDDVLTVDDRGTVTPHAPGNATVVCMTESGLSAVCQFQVCPEATALTLNYGEKIKLGVGETIDFDSYVNSGAAACWRYYSSDNENAVKVERFGGIAKAVGEGKANVTCVLENGVQARCEVTVEKLAQSLELNATAVTLVKGDKFDFDSYARDGYAYFRDYHSLDESIASFARNDGIVTANKIGKTQIYCELINGVRAYAEVTVTDAPTSIAVNKQTDRVQVGELLRVSVTGNEGSAINNSFINVTSSNGLVTVADKGVDYIELMGMKLGATDVTFATQNGMTQTVRLYVEGSKALCIDISTWQGAYVDFDKVKQSGVDYVILRAGYGNDSSQIDNQFANNYNKAKRAGLKVGVYWFSYATDELDALNEADACIACIGGRQLDMPVYYDIEYEKALKTMSYDELTRMALFFCNKIILAGYRPGVYTSVTVYQNQIDYDLLVENGISIWNAHWAPRCTIDCDIWQYSENGFVWGVDGDVDMNLIYNLNIVE